MGRPLANASLLPHNTFGMDVSADWFFEYFSVEELREALPQLQRPLLNIGEGSNLLFCGDFHGTVLHCGIRSAEIVSQEDKSLLAHAGAGLKWDSFVEWCICRGLYGAENLSGIPGEVGASAVQNIGAYGAEACEMIDTVETVDALTGELRVFKAEECEYAYRDSIFKRPENKRYIITGVTFRLSTEWKPNLKYKALAEAFEGKTPTAGEVRSAVIDMRDSKLPDPKILGNAGSFFMNPVVPQPRADVLSLLYPDMPRYAAGEGLVKLSAAWLIDHGGWKGQRMGRAGVYEKQPLVLVNLGGATGEEIIALAQTIIDDI
ncbi:MAG: UDP-N-acetylmuramate dehydrogenase, partial [Bacteroidales bacterium]|nr:UDP-N-acetylmuramate dehydrogenase [Bacteroidales bacterium]